MGRGLASSSGVKCLAEEGRELSGQGGKGTSPSSHREEHSGKTAWSPQGPEAIENQVLSKKECRQVYEQCRLRRAA